MNINLLEKLKTYPLFRMNDFCKITKYDAEYARTYIYRMKKRGLIKKIEKGKYTVYEDPLIFATHIKYPSYISMWSLFSLKGLTEQVLQELQIITNLTKEIKFMNTRISFTKSKYLFGYKKELYNEHEIFIAEIEKAIIDSLLYWKAPFDEIVKAIKNARLNKKHLMEYTQKISSSSLNKRLGFLLEKHGYNTKLYKKIDNNYVLLNPFSNKKGIKNTKWRLIIND